MISAAGKPKAHFSLRLGTSAAVNPAAFADCMRALLRSAPQPFHIGSDVKDLITGFAGHGFDINFASVSRDASTFRPPRYPAIMRFSSSETSASFACVVPVVIAA